MFDAGPQKDMLGELEDEIILFDLATILFTRLHNNGFDRSHYPGIRFFKESNIDRIYTAQQSILNKKIATLNSAFKKDAWGIHRKGGRRTPFSPQTSISIKAISDLLPVLKLLEHLEIVRTITILNQKEYYFKSDHTLGIKNAEYVEAPIGEI